MIRPATFDPAHSLFIPLATVLETVDPAVQEGRAGGPDPGALAKSVGARWGCSKLCRVASGLALEWSQPSASPVYLEVNQDGVCTRRPRGSRGFVLAGTSRPHLSACNSHLFPRPRLTAPRRLLSDPLALRPKRRRHLDRAFE